MIFFVASIKVNKQYNIPEYILCLFLIAFFLAARIMVTFSYEFSGKSVIPKFDQVRESSFV